MIKKQFVLFLLLLTAIIALAVSAVLGGNTQIAINLFMLAITIYFFLFLKNQITLNNRIESVLLRSGIAPISLAMISMTAVLSVHFSSTRRFK